MDAQKDAQGSTDCVADGDDVGHSKVADQRKVALIVGILFESLSLLSLFCYRGSLPMIKPGMWVRSLFKHYCT